MQIVAGNQNKLAFTADGRCETPVASRWLYLVLSDSTLLPRVKGCVGVFFFGGEGGRGRGTKANLFLELTTKMCLGRR